MNLFKNKKGQGGDTFKLLIAAVVAMVILGIVTGVFQNISDLIFGISCVDNPINELVTTIQRSQGGIITSTKALCMNPGESFTAKTLTEKVTNVRSAEFKCGPESQPDSAAVCSGGVPIKVESGATGSSISASGSARFKGLISCEGVGGSDYTCIIWVESA